MAFIFLGGEHSKQNATKLKSGGGRGDVAHATANARERLFISTRERLMNSDALARKDGGRGLMDLATKLQGRCDLVIKRKGERIPK